MKKIYLVTIQDYKNFGNRLQNYAMQKVLSDAGFSVYTLVNNYTLTNNSVEKLSIMDMFKLIIKRIYVKFFHNKKSRWFMEDIRESKFHKFNNLINRLNLGLSNKEDWINNHPKDGYYVVGSDQVWNPDLWPDQFMFMLGFSEKERNVAVAASIAVDKLTADQHIEFEKYIHNFKAISCREMQGVTLLKNEFGVDAEQIIDPTLMLSVEDWTKIEKKPRFIKSNSGYVLVYFLGSISKSRNNFFGQYAKEHNLKIINISDINSPYYMVTPDEFIYLIHNASMIFTDSFHAMVFSIIFDKNFRVLEREDTRVSSMNSRISTLIKILNIPEYAFCRDDELSLDLKKISIDRGLLKEQQDKFNKFIEENLH